MAICQNPRAKPRHEPINVKLFTTKKTSKYLDFFSEPCHIRSSGVGIVLTCGTLRECKLHLYSLCGPWLSHVGVSGGCYTKSAWNCWAALFQPVLAKEGEWISVDAYFQEKAPPEAKKRHKTFAAKRSWIKASRLHSERGKVFIPTARYMIRLDLIIYRMQDANFPGIRNTVSDIYFIIQSSNGCRSDIFWRWRRVNPRRRAWRSSRSIGLK